ncbi:MAG: ABC transporter ATP-binding protein [Ideonella sp.]|jgi:iron complex transport system ATP-binding protein|nr:ABC transporter ATP-binding protein [Ideonella sp.]
MTTPALAPVAGNAMSDVASRQGRATAPWRAPGVPPARLRLTGVVLHAGHRAGGRQLFGPLDLEVAPGERWVVLGPNGAGKSSLLAAMAGLARPGRGAMTLDGIDLSAWRPAALARRRAWCPQFWSDPFAATVRETATLAMPEEGPDTVDGERAVSAVLEALDLDALADADVRALSGGERQRVAMATTLLQGAPLLLLDEPASHLDLLHQQALLGVLRAHAASGGSVVASVHELNLAWDLASHAVLLDGRGGAVAGPRAQVLTAAQLAAAFGVPIHRVEVCGHERFWIGPAAPGGHTP